MALRKERAKVGGLFLAKFVLRAKTLTFLPIRMPPRGATVLAAMVVVTGAGIGYVHWSQRAERAAMREGVIRDKARLQAKLAERAAAASDGRR